MSIAISKTPPTAADLAAPVLEPRTCQQMRCRQCGDMFMQKRWWQECCSDKCRSAWRQLHYITIPKEEYDRLVVLAKLGVERLRENEATAAAKGVKRKTIKQ